VKGTAQGENSFKDYSVGGSYDLGNDYSLGLTYHKVSFKDSAAKTVWFEPTDGLNTQAQIFKSGVVLSLSKSF
jgi:predicted porin